MPRSGAAYVLGQVPGGWLLDRFGSKRVYGAGIFLWSLFTFLQGFVGLLGVQGALLWAVLMAFLSLVPAVGAALVWAPVAGFLALQGHWPEAIGLTAWGVLAIGMVDNLLRPILVGKDTRLPDYVVMISTLGGMSVFGINGFVLGPVIAAMFMAVWHIWAPASDVPSSAG